MDCGINRDFTRLDHVSMVTNPDDKRCVVEIPETSEQFKLLRHIWELVRDQKLRISEFERIRFLDARFPIRNRFDLSTESNYPDVFLGSPVDSATGSPSLLSHDAQRS